MAIETSKITYGGDMMFFISNKPIAFSTSAKLDVTMGTRDVGSKDSGNWDEKAPAKINWSASTDALMTDNNLAVTTTTYAQLFNLMKARLPITMVFATMKGVPAAQVIDNTTVGKVSFTGTGIITSISMNADDGANGTYSVAFEGTGELGVTTNPIL